MSTEKVNAPAIALLVTAIIGIAFNLLAIVLNLAGVTSTAALAQMYKNMGIPVNTQMLSGAVNMITNVLGIAGGAFVIYGSLQMKNLKSWGLALAAAILAMIPCFSPCCILGLPFGIWALVVLVNEDVKKAFT